MLLFLHRNRRDLMAKAMLDIFKLTAVAGCVSGFFPGFSIGTRSVVFCMIGLSFICGVLLCPPSEKEK